ncbi:unnamed protein product [Adineta steineri]|uniref:Uncharacterized protein n=1 Tax=Adineta steineri TaxID=433720 RepID=A0A814BD23_9BILA|nr:unnamed protein product [Adineta steineri]
MIGGIPPLIYDQASSRFPPKTTISTIVQAVMVDQWNFVYSYDLYWKACAPAYCTYSDSIHTNNFVGILIIMISMIGGLMAALRLIIPPAVNFVYGLFTPKARKENQGNR